MGLLRLLEREKHTIKVMLEMYCNRRHNSSGVLCPGCATVFNYALERIERCPYKGNKPACSKCPTHCYAPAMREQIRAVMKFAGPRMLMAHPLLAALHFINHLFYPVPKSRG